MLPKGIEDSAKRKYDRLRKKGMDHDAAVRASRADAAFDYLASLDDLLDSCVKLDVVPDEEMFDDSYLEDDEKAKKELQERIEEDGVWGVKTFYFSYADGEWEEVDAVWGFVGEDWRDSGYDTDLKIAALKAYAGQKRVGHSHERTKRDLFLEIARYGLGETTAPLQLPPGPSPVPVPKVPPHFFSRHTFQIRQGVYGGWNVLRFEQRPDRPPQIEQMTTALEPKSEAINVAKSYAQDLAERMTPNPNPVRVLNEYGECVFAVKSTTVGVLEVPCPESIIKNPRRRRRRARR